MTDRAPATRQASFQRANDESRERLASLISTLTPTQLTIDLGEGWTVASALGHMGFWDRWQAARWTEMLAGRWTADDASIIAAEHLANDALHPYWAGIDTSDIPALALEAATKLDSLIASAPDALVDALEGTSSAYLLHRHRHRGDHLDHIERSIAAAEAAVQGVGGPTAASTAARPLDRSFIERNAEGRRRMADLVGPSLPPTWPARPSRAKRAAGVWPRSWGISLSGIGRWRRAGVLRRRPLETEAPSSPSAFRAG
jgi:hypothetical protein